MNDSQAYNRAELRKLKSAFKAMDQESIDQAKIESSALATFASQKIAQTAYGRTVSATAVQRVVDGVKISKSSKLGEFSYGFASQRFSGGATTQILWAGLEFGSKKYKQFPTWNKSGYFIYPTLREIQPQIIAKWELAFSKITEKWDN